MNSQTEIETEVSQVEQKPRQWTSSAGPLQTKRASQALKRITEEGQTYDEVYGVKGSESKSSLWSPFSPPRAEAVKASQEIGEKFNWTITRDNHQQIIAAVGECLIELRKSRPCEDKSRTPEEDEAMHAEFRARQQEEERKQQEKKQEADRLASDLRKQYPWAVLPRNGLSENARVGQNIRIDLERSFPGIKFTVRSEPTRVYIHWEMGPTEKALTEVVGKYQSSHWENDGGDGYSKYDHTASGLAIEKVLGRVHHVDSSRAYNEIAFTETARLICEHHGKAFDGNMHARGIVEWEEHYDLRDLCYQTLHRTDFAAGAVIKGIEDAQDDPDPQVRWRLVLEVPPAPTFEEQNAQPMTILESGITIRRNLAKEGIEMRFAHKPPATTLSSLKANGWRWAFHNKCWYTRFTQEAWEFAHKLVGQDAPAIPAESGGDRFDMAVEDQMKEACGL